MSSDDNARLVKTVMEQFMQAGPEPLLAAITDDAEIKAILPEGTPISGEFRGRDG